MYRISSLIAIGALLWGATGVLHAAPAPTASLPELQNIQRKLAGLRCKDSDSRWSQKRILQLIPTILNGEDIDYSGPDMKGNTCLHYACELGSRQLIHWLVENGADVNRVETGGGNTPLHNAARLASLNTVNYLLEHGANPNVRNNEGKLPADVVGKDDHDAIVTKLTTGKGDVGTELNEKSGVMATGPTPTSIYEGLYRMQMALRNLKTDSAEREEAKIKSIVLLNEVLKTHNVSIGSFADEYSTDNILFLSSILDFCPMVELALSTLHLPVNIQDGDGDTPLHLAAKNKSWKAMDVLLKHGASPEIYNKKGETPIALYKRMRDCGNIFHKDKLLSQLQENCTSLPVQRQMLSAPQAMTFRDKHPFELNEDIWEKQFHNPSGYLNSYIVPDSRNIDAMYSLEMDDAPIKYLYHLESSRQDDIVLTDEDDVTVTCSSSRHNDHPYKDKNKDDPALYRKSITFWNTHTLHYMFSVLLASNLQRNWRYWYHDKLRIMGIHFDDETIAPEADFGASGWLAIDYGNQLVESVYSNPHFEINHEVKENYAPSYLLNHFRSENIFSDKPKIGKEIRLNDPHRMRHETSLAQYSSDFLSKEQRDIRELDFNTLRMIPSISSEPSENVTENYFQRVPQKYKDRDAAMHMAGRHYVDTGKVLYNTEAGTVIPLSGFEDVYSVGQLRYEHTVSDVDSELTMVSTRACSYFEGCLCDVTFLPPFIYNDLTDKRTFLIPENELASLKKLKAPWYSQAGHEQSTIVIKGANANPHGSIFNIANRIPGENDDSYYWISVDNGLCTLSRLNLTKKTCQVVQQWEGLWRTQLRDEAIGTEIPCWLPERKWLCLPYKPHCWKILALDESSLKTELKCYVYLRGKHEFAVVLPNGIYAGSPGCEDFLYTEKDQVRLGIAPFAQWRNRPGEVLAALGGNPDDVQALRQATGRWLEKIGADEAHTEPAVADLPSVRVQYPQLHQNADSCAFTVAASGNRDSCFVEVMVDGTKYTATILSPGEEQSLCVPLVVGENWIEVVPTDILKRKGDTVRFRVLRSGKKDSDVYVVAMGVSEYEDAAFNLEYAAKDAADIAKAFERFGGSGCHVLCLTNQEVSKEAPNRISEFLKNVRSEDRVILYCAGHGILDEKLNYYYAPYAIDMQRLDETGVSMDELKNILLQTPARDRLLLLDTCHAGLIGEEGEIRLAQMQQQLPSGVRAIATRGLKVKSVPKLSVKQKQRYIEELFSVGEQSRGINIISASAGAELAMESDKWSNGVFTVAILEALSGCGDDNMDGTLSVNELAAYVTGRVTRATNGAQKPAVSALENTGRMKVVDNVGSAIHAQDWARAEKFISDGAHLDDGNATADYSWIGLAVEYKAPVSFVEKLLQAGASLNKHHELYLPHPDLYDDYGSLPKKDYQDKNTLDLKDSDTFLNPLMSAEYGRVLGGALCLSYLQNGKADSIREEHIKNLSARELSKMLDAGFNPNARFREGRQTIHCMRDASAIQLLLEKGANPNAKDEKGNTPLHYACNPQAIDVLSKHGGDINARNASGDTPLLTVEKDKATVQALLKNGANVHACNKHGYGALWQYIDKPEIMELLFANGAQIADESMNLIERLINSISRAESKEAAKRGLQTLELLMQHGADAQAIMQYAADVPEGESRDQIFKLLQKYGAHRNGSSWTKTERAVLGWNLNTARDSRMTSMAKQIQNILDGNNVDDLCGDEKGNTLLMYAAYVGNDKLCTRLIEHGANIQCRNKEGWNPIIFAVYKGNTDCVKVLLKHGADPNTRTEESTTVLMLAAMFGHVDTLKLLLQNGADVNARTKNNKTALDLAHDKGIIEVMNILQEKGAK